MRPKREGNKFIMDISRDTESATSPAHWTVPDVPRSYSSHASSAGSRRSPDQSNNPTSPDLCPRAKGTHIQNARMSSSPKPDWRMASDRIDVPGVCRVSPPLARLGGQGPVLL